MPTAEDANAMASSVPAALQPRFTRDTSNPAKPRFTHAPHSRLHSSRARQLLQHCAACLPMRRTKRRRALAALAALLTLVLLAMLVSVGYMRSRLRTVDVDGRASHHARTPAAAAADAVHIGGAALAGHEDVADVGSWGVDGADANAAPVANASAAVVLPASRDSAPVPVKGATASGSGALAVRGDSAAMEDVRQKYGAGKMSIVVLFHNEFETLRAALNSWVNNGLVDYADEILFFLNGVSSEDNFNAQIPDYEGKIPAEKRRIQLSKENLPLGIAITRMVELASHEYVLLMEKDWELIEERSVMESRLIDSKVLLGSGVANLVRHRHRHNPGVPLHALIMHQGREESILRVQKNLLCYTHHWQKDPTIMFPGAGIMRRCGGVENNIEEDDVFCAPSAYCQWTNNPGIFSRKWFIDEVGNEFKKQYAIEKGKHGPTSPFLDFEYYTNWRPYAWTDKDFTIAVGTGLFRHAETEHQYFNTFWYAHYRLTVDFEEIRSMYLKNETTFKKLGGVHYDPNGPPPPPMIERYPVDFVRKFQHADVFTGSLETQRAMINEQYNKYLSTYRITTEEEWNATSRPAWNTTRLISSNETSSTSDKAMKHVNWRAEITALHHVVEKAMMIAPPKQPHEMNITLVTCLLDLGRDSLAADTYQFRRDFKMYIDAMANWLTHDYKKVVYTTKEIADELLKTASEEVKTSTKFVHITREELRTKWIGPDNYDRIQHIRTSPDWLMRAGWLQNSPQARLNDYNALVMSKMFMMRDAARQNYWDTTHFVFLDAKHNCQQPKIMNPKNDHIIRAHMFDKLLMTQFDYQPSTEVHGFEYTAFNKYCNMKEPEKPQLVKVGRGGIFGGSAFVLEYITAMYDVALTATLREGLMGTEENIFSILFYQVQHYVDAFSNNWACPDKIPGDHSCPNKKNQGYNCAIFEWVARDAVAR